MKLRLLAILLTAPLWACASQPNSGASSSNAGAGNSAPAASAAPSSGPSALSIIATPLYLVFKLPVCLGAAPLAGPGVVASAAVPFSDKSSASGSDLLVKDVKEACGPPYIANAH